MESIIAGAATGAVLAVRSGPRGMALSATVGAVILAVMEGANVMISKMSSSSFDPQPLPPSMNLAKSQPALPTETPETPDSSFVADPKPDPSDQTSQARQSAPFQTGLFKGRFGIA
ncbi:hypothetical protein BSLG_006074 [Batrachochytrium salamandrivorans]|nr:hypothetical protein BSLG_006074 [Batrachochytrium salamandrivorans]